ncbi:MAG: hypothetical protein D6689_10360 [Deltaproteobacteria bacterium]|nr:MAG: hypothetical protein D6689_10360 [Deltaproteobacteria bacterium]
MRAVSRPLTVSSGRWFAAAAVAVALAVPSSARAQRRAGGSLGLGLVVGDPTGVTLEYHRRRPGFGHAIELAVGLDTFDDSDVYVHLIWKFYLAELVRGSAVDVPIYTGVGPWIAEHDHAGHDGDIHVGGRMPFGIALDFRRAPLQVYFELALDLQLVHDVDLGVDGAIGFRWYF